MTNLCFPRFTPGLGALGGTGGSSGSSGSNSAPGDNPSPTTGATEPGHQQFIQQMLQALAGVNPQVKILFCSHFIFLVGNLEISTNNQKQKETVLRGLECHKKHTLIKQALRK